MSHHRLAGDGPNLYCLQITDARFALLEPAQNHLFKCMEAATLRIVPNIGVSAGKLACNFPTDKPAEVHEAAPVVKADRFVQR